jgi:Fic family protein
MWIYDNLAWPNFTWDNHRLASKLAQTRHLQGLLLGKMASLGFDLQQESSLNTLTNDVVKSSAIEGENLNPSEVRSSIARRLGIKIEDSIAGGRDVEGIVEIMLDATQSYSKPLTSERLFAWHSALFTTKRSGMHAIVVGCLAQ